MTGDPHSEPLGQCETWIREAIEDYASAWDLTIEQQNDLVGTMVTVFGHALAASEASAEELRREVARLNTVTAWYEEKHRQRRAQVYAAEASAQRLTEELETFRKVARMVDSYYSASLDYKPPYVLAARAALDEAQKVKL